MIKTKTHRILWTWMEVSWEGEGTREWPLYHRGSLRTGLIAHVPKWRNSSEGFWKVKATLACGFIKVTSSYLYSGPHRCFHVVTVLTITCKEVLCYYLKITDAETEVLMVLVSRPINQVSGRASLALKSLIFPLHFYYTQEAMTIFFLFFLSVDSKSEWFPFSGHAE